MSITPTNLQVASDNTLAGYQPARLESDFDTMGKGQKALHVLGAVATLSLYYWFGDAFKKTVRVYRPADGTHVNTGISEKEFDQIRLFNGGKSLESLSQSEIRVRSNQVGTAAMKLIKASGLKNRLGVEHLGVDQIVALAACLYDANMQPVQDAISRTDRDNSRVLGRGSIGLKQWAPNRQNMPQFRLQIEKSSVTRQRLPSLDLSRVDAIGMQRCLANYDQECAVRHFVADLLFPESPWDFEDDPDKNAERIKQVCLKHSKTLYQIYKDPKMLRFAELPPHLRIELGMQIGEFKQKLPRNVRWAIGMGVINVDDGQAQKLFHDQISKTELEEFAKLDRRINEECASSVLLPVDPLASLAMLNTGDLVSSLSLFAKRVFWNYFSRQAPVDIRKMCASLLRGTLRNSSHNDRLVAVLLGAGPYLQKLLQLYGQNTQNKELRAALETLKHKLPPVSVAMKFRLTKLFWQRTRLGIIGKMKSLGAASVGEVVRVQFTRKANNMPNELAMKIRRPGVKNQAAREHKFFEQIAKDSPGMLRTFNGIAERIQEELDLTREAENIRQANEVYNARGGNIHAMTLAKGDFESDQFLLVDVVPGPDVCEVLAELAPKDEQEPKDELAPKDEDAQNGNDIEERCQRAEALGATLSDLAAVWFDEAIFRSGFYHGDLHSGNLKFVPRPPGQDADAPRGDITMLDWGNAGTLTPKQQKAFLKLMKAVHDGRSKQIVSILSDLLPDDALTPSKEQLDQLTLQTDDILNGNAGSPIESICRVLDRFNDQGIEVPSLISNFSRSALMLEQQMQQLDGVCSDLERHGSRQIQRYSFADAIEKAVKQGVDNLSLAEKLQLA